MYKRKSRYHGRHRRSGRALTPDGRMKAIQWILYAVGVIFIARLGFLQIVQHRIYDALASGQRQLYEELFPERGEVLVRDPGGIEMPLITNQYLYFVWTDPRRVEDPEETADKLAEVLGYFDPPTQEASAGEGEEAEEESEAEPEPTKYERLLAKLSKEDDPYEPIEKRVSAEVADQIEALELPGVYLLRERFRFYPEAEQAGHLTGFVNEGEEGFLQGNYGIEGYFHEELAGTPGYLFSELDTKGRWISVGVRNQQEAEDGADLLLTIDRAMQYNVCSILADAVERHQADSGSAIVMDPKTGAVLAMCGAPQFDPNRYNEVESIAIYNNQVTFDAYEPGSVFKPIVAAAALDVGAITPQTGYEDTGEVKIETHTIRNSDLESHGWQTMTQVLEKSLNTGMIFMMRQMGQEAMTRYISQFGFGERTGIELDTEVAGDLSSLDGGYEIYGATASYGQGITTTLLQIARAYAVLANGGKQVDPYLVEEVRYADGTVDVHDPVPTRQVIAPRTSQTISAMLVSTVENGFANNAAVDGYYVAGKTGTAQVANRQTGGYLQNHTIATFAGFAPARDPAFVLAVRIDRPRTSPWASDTAAPAFQEMAEYLLQYGGIAPER